jgi:hypothetical protein
MSKKEPRAQEAQLECQNRRRNDLLEKLSRRARLEYDSGGYEDERKLFLNTC